MASNLTKAIIELGNIKIKCIIFKVNENNEVEILSSSRNKSEGIHNGTVVNLAKATNAIRFCISSAEKEAKTSLKKISVILEQPEFLCTKFSKHKKINGSKILKDDIEFLLKDAKKQVILNDDKQSIIHIFNHNYIVDGKKFDDEPIDVFADYLSHEMTFVTMPKNNIKNINQAFIDCDIEIERFISTTFALAVKLFDRDLLQSGCSLIDIGYEKISLGLFKNLALIHSITFPVGTHHFTKDISKVCSLTLQESEKIKNEMDFSLKNNNKIFDDKEILKSSYFITSSFRKISKSLILNVVKSRLDEISEMIKKQVLLSEYNSIYNSNMFIAGGGSKLNNLEQYFSDFFSTNVKYLECESKNENEKNFVSCLGALKIINDGWETEAIPEPTDKNSQKLSFLGRIFGNRS